MRTTALLTLALLAASACSPPLFARSRVQLAVIDRDSGQWLPEYRRRGDTWIPGTPGHRYAVRLTNTSSERMLVVLSVDGVNAVSGETADLNQAGYVLSPGQSTDINGWRKSLDDVAQFVFTDFPDSYAARTSRPDNVGVIGIAVFEEARPPVTTRRSRRRTACRPKPSASPKRRRPPRRWIARRKQARLTSISGPATARANTHASNAPNSCAQARVPSS